MLSKEKIDARLHYVPPIAFGEVNLSLTSLLVTFSITGEIEDFDGEIEEL